MDYRFREDPWIIVLEKKIHGLTEMKCLKFMKCLKSDLSGIRTCEAIESTHGVPPTGPAGREQSYIVVQIVV